MHFHYSSRYFLLGESPTKALVLAGFTGLLLTQVPSVRALEIHVARNGSDAGRGDAGQPFATIERARRAVRELAPAMREDIKVNIHAGDYFLDRPLQFTPADSGRNGKRVIYSGAAGPGRTRLLGGKIIAQDQWRTSGEHLYVARLRGLLPFTVIYEDGQRARLARTPNRGYFTVAQGSNSRRWFIADSNQPAISAPEGVTVFAWLDGHDWDSDRIPLAGFEVANRRMELTRDARGSLYADTWSASRYFLEGARAWLDAPGEFFYDAASEQLSYWPFKPSSSPGEVIVPQLTDLIRCIGDPTGVVQNLVFENLQLIATLDDRRGAKTEANPPAQNAQVYLENACNIFIRRCRIANAGMHGLCLNGAVSNVTIEENEIFDCGHSGVTLIGPGPSLREVNTGNIILKNTIREVGQTYAGFIGGIYLLHSGHNLVVSNWISDSPRYGISIKGVAYSRMNKSYEGMEVTQGNYHEFLPARDNRIEFNDVSRCNLDSQDSGAIEAWGCGRSNRITSNRIYDSGCFGIQSGIYLDDGASYTLVASNLVYGIRGGDKAQPIYVKGIANRLIGNVFDATGNQRALLNMAYGGDDSDQLHIEGNIFYNRTAGDCVYQFWNWSPTRVAFCDHNLIFHQSGIYKVVGPTANPDFAEWRHLYDRRFDQHSSLDDPQFADPLHHDYRRLMPAPKNR